MDRFSQPLSEGLRATAMALPEATEGTSCVNRAFRVGKKAFFYLGEKPDHIKLMVKLGSSLPAVQAMDDPRISVGTFGWTTVRVPLDDLLELGLLAGWVEESYRELVPKKLVARLGG